jgi:hypothetical protein
MIPESCILLIPNKASMETFLPLEDPMKVDLLLKLVAMEPFNHMKEDSSPHLVIKKEAITIDLPCKSLLEMVAMQISSAETTSIIPDEMDLHHEWKVDILRTHLILRLIKVDTMINEATVVTMVMEDLRLPMMDTVVNMVNH